MKNYNAKKQALLFVANIHGSGIDYDYTITESRNNVVINNAIHCMDENGYYDGVLPFQVLINKKTAKIVNIKFGGSGSYHRRKYAWNYSDYLWQLFTDEYKEYERPYYLRSFDVK